MQLSDASFIVVDLETTGLSPERNRITEIAMLRVEEGEIVDRYESLVNPECTIPSFISEMTGITNAMVFNKPKFVELLPEVEAFIGDAENVVIAGHNVKFDHGFLLQSILRSKTANPIQRRFPDYPTLCTARLARRMTKLERRTLKHVADYFGIKIKSRHRAMGDAEATALALIQFIELAIEEHECESLEDVLKLQKRVTKPAKRTVVHSSLVDEVRNFPHRPGVYLMRSAKGGLLYVGKAKDLHDRVMSYFSTSAIDSRRKLARMMRSVRTIEYQETGSELSALLKESRLIKELKPQFNTLERSWKSFAFLKLDVQNLFPRLDAVREISLDGAEYYGPFRAKKSVVALIEVLNRSFKLRECEGELSVDPKTRPCFYYDIGRCNAPCAGLESTKKYGAEVDRFRAFLAAGENGILALIERMMQEAADRLEFEEAQFLKLRYAELKKLFGNGDRPMASVNANDVVILARASGKQVEIFFVRFGRLVKQSLFGVEELGGAEHWFEKQLRLYYPVGTNAVPPVCGQAEVDEMRMLAAWAEKKREDTSAAIIYVTREDETLPARLATALKSMMDRSASTAGMIESQPRPPAPSRFTPTEVKVAKRLVLKPMYKRM